MMKNKAMLRFILLIVTMFTLSACGNSEDAASTEVISDEAMIQKIAETKLGMNLPVRNIYGSTDSSRTAGQNHR